MAISSRPPASPPIVRPPAGHDQATPAPTAPRRSPKRAPRGATRSGPSWWRRLADALGRLYGPAPRQPFRKVGHDSAARVFATMVAALGLAALINADALVERAEEKP